MFNEKNCKISRYNKSTVIYFQNQVCNTLDVILEGIVQIQKIDENGNILVVAEFGTGDILGENLIFSDARRYPMTVFSKKNSTILHIRKELVLRLCQQDENFLHQFMREMSNKTLLIGNRLKSVTLKTIRQHIINFLVEQYHKQNSPEIKLEMTKKEWAEKIGVHRPSLSRELSKMKKEGLIDYDNKRILIKDH